MGGRQKSVYTIGYGTRKLDDFLTNLRQNGIEALVDVRRFPTSKRKEFQQAILRRILKKHGIRYYHLSGLGGYRGGYVKHMRTPEFKEALQELVRIAKHAPTVIMCLEENPRACHRRYIASAMKKQGFKVYHILADGSLRSSLPPRGR